MSQFLNFEREGFLSREGARFFLSQVIKERDPDLLVVAVLFLIKVRARDKNRNTNRNTDYLDQKDLRVERLFGELGFEVKIQ